MGSVSTHHIQQWKLDDKKFPHIKKKSVSAPADSDHDWHLSKSLGSMTIVKSDIGILPYIVLCTN